MIVVGLTGGIASGKSTVAAMLQKKGAHLLDADKLAREAVAPGKPAWQEIVAWLGQEVLKEDQTIDRLRLANLVFNDRAKLERLNKIVHPHVGARFMALAAEIRDKHPQAILVYDVPLLIEAGLHKKVDRVVLVYVPRETQVERLIKRDGLSPAAAAQRLRAQLPLEEKRRHAHHIIDNSGSLEETARRVQALWDELKNLPPAGQVL